MLVALAVLVLALAVVTNVFSVTARTAAASAAIAEVENLARTFADQLTEDLRYCDPARSILVIHGRTQAAALTEEERQAGLYYRVLTGDPGLVPPAYDTRFDNDPGQPNGTAPRDQFSDPRADILMFFTNRPSVSKAPPTADPGSLDAFQQKLQQGAAVAPIQVVYGHAALDRAVQSGTRWDFADELEHIDSSDPYRVLSPLPAQRWHLARRAVLLEPPPAAGALPPLPQFTNSDFDRIVRCYAGSNSRVAGDWVQFSLDQYLAVFQPYLDASGELTGRAEYSPYLFPTIGGSPPLAFGHIPWPAGDRAWVDRVLYWHGDGRNHHVATVIERPPAALASNLGVHLVPGCVWFQVEILIPEDPRNGLDSPLSDQRRDTPRWVEVDPGASYVFVPDSEENRRLVEGQIYLTGPRAGRVLPAPNRLASFAQVIPPGMARQLNMPHDGDTPQNRRVRMWPYAVRVTIRVIDPQGRLAEPIVRSVVHRFE